MEEDGKLTWLAHCKTVTIADRRDNDEVNIVVEVGKDPKRGIEAGRYCISLTRQQAAKLMVDLQSHVAT